MWENVGSWLAHANELLQNAQHLSIYIINRSKCELVTFNTFSEQNKISYKILMF